MNLIKQYVKEYKNTYIQSVLLAVLGVVSGLAAYIVLAKMIVGLIGKNTEFGFYLQYGLMVLAAMVLKEIFAVGFHFHIASGNVLFLKKDKGRNF